MSRHPVNRCAVKGCPMVGHWPHDHMCPMHRNDPDQGVVTITRQPTRSNDE